MNLPAPNYAESVVSVANSVLKEFGCEQHHPGLPELDEILAAGNYKNVILMVLDGLGYDLLERHLPEDAFLRRHLVRGISSVYPPTTTTAITSFVTGLTPAEHGWLGWSLYYEDMGRAVSLFGNQDMETDAFIEGRHLAHTLLPYEDISSAITKTGKATGHMLQNFDGSYTDEPDMARKLLELIEKPGRRYVYCYNCQPDYMLHYEGTQSPNVTEQIAKLNAACEQVGREMKNTLLIVTADHGLVDLEREFSLEELPALMETLRAPADLDSRNIGFRPKPGREDDFLREARAAFGEEALILTKDEMIASKLYGNLDNGKDYPRLRERLADYIVILPPGTRYWRKASSLGKHKAAHSGADAREMKVPLVAAGN